MEYFAWRRAGLFNLAHDTYHSLGKPDAAFEEAGAGDVGEVLNLHPNRVILSPGTPVIDPYLRGGTLSNDGVLLD